MKITQLSRWKLSFGFSLLLVFGYFMQVWRYDCPDTTWLLHLAGEILSGKQYGKDIFETNPPMALLLDIPVIVLHRFTQWDTWTLFRIYIYGLTVASIGLVYSILLTYLPVGERWIARMIPGTLAVCLVALPANDFGQRDVLWLTLMLPWLFATVPAIQGHPLKGWRAVLAGLMAGAGFAMKPYFLVPLCLVEGFCIWHRRSLFAVWRTETILILLIMLLHLGWIAEYQPGYFQVILPLVMRYYFKSIYFPVSIVMMNPVCSLFPLGVCIYYLLFQRDDHYPMLGRVLFLGTLGAVCSCLLARTPWLYHATPGLVLSCVLLVYLTASMMKQSGGMRISQMTFVPMLFAALWLSIPVFWIADIGHADIHKFEILQANAVAKYVAGKEGELTFGCLSLGGTVDCFMPVDYAHGRYLSGMPFLWWFRGLKKTEVDHAEPLERLARDFRFLSEITAREIERYKPHWILASLETGEDRINIKERRHSIDTIRKLRLNPALDRAMAKYQFRKAFNTLLIYERQPEPVVTASL